MSGCKIKIAAICFKYFKEVLCVFEKRVTISSAMSKKVIEYLEKYIDPDYKFIYLQNSTSLNAVFKVETTENDDEKIIKKIKDGIKASPFGNIINFSVKVE